MAITHDDGSSKIRKTSMNIELIEFTILEIVNELRSWREVIFELLSE